MTLSSVRINGVITGLTDAQKLSRRQLELCIQMTKLHSQYHKGGGLYTQVMHIQIKRVMKQRALGISEIDTCYATTS